MTATKNMNYRCYINGEGEGEYIDAPTARVAAGILAKRLSTVPDCIGLEIVATDDNGDSDSVLISQEQ